MQKLVYGDIFGEAWNALKADLPLVAGLTAVYGFGVWVLHFIPFANFILIGPLAIGYLRSLMQIRKREVIGFNDFLWGYSDFNRFLHIVIMNVILSLGMTLGYLLLIIPGVWFTVASMFSAPIFATSKPDGVEAIKASMDMVKGRWWNLAGFVLLLGLINIAGLICLFIGILISAPLTGMAVILATEKLAAAAPTVTTTPSPEAPSTVS